MSRLVLLGGALLLSAVVPVSAIAIVVSHGSSQGDQQTIQMPTAPSRSVQPSPGIGAPDRVSPPAAPAATAGSTSVKLFDGKQVWISSSCADSHDLSTHKADAIAAAKQMPRLKQALLNSRSDLARFLAAHPEHYLTHANYTSYKYLDATYKSALATYNRQVDLFNQLADRFNADLEACKT